MLEEIIREINEMEYPADTITKELYGKCVTNVHAAAAFGFMFAQGMIKDIVCQHSND